MVPGDAIGNHFFAKDVGDTYSLKGRQEEKHYGIFYLKYPDCMMKTMSTYYVLKEYTVQKGSTRSFTNITNETKTLKFKYKSLFGNYFKYCLYIDEHSSLRHSKSSPEEIWFTQHWPNILCLHIEEFLFEERNRESEDEIMGCEYHYW